MQVKVKFTEGFKDGTIFPDRSFAPNDVAVLTEAQFQQVQRSGGQVEVIEHVLANPLKAEKEAQRKREEMADPQNAENAINDLENHVPGLENEVEEVRRRESEKKPAKKK